MKTIDRILFIYSSLFVIALTIGALTNAAQGGSNLISLLFLIPVVGYLIFQIVITFYRIKYRAKLPAKAIKPEATRLKLVNLPEKHSFFRQNSPAFLLTISLFTMLLTAVLLKTILPTPVVEQASAITN
jgi:hypothetical protein